MWIYSPRRNFYKDVTWPQSISRRSAESSSRARDGLTRCLAIPRVREVFVEVRIAPQGLPWNITPVEDSTEMITFDIPVHYPTGSTLSYRRWYCQTSRWANADLSFWHTLFTMFTPSGTHELGILELINVGLERHRISSDYRTTFETKRRMRQHGLPLKA